MRTLLILLSLCFSVNALAQTGKVSGKINDGEFNDVLPFANVLVKGTTTGVTSDFDGEYSIELAPGTYTLVFSFLGYGTVEVAEVEVKANEVTLVNVTLNPTSSMLDEVVITTTARKNTEEAVLKLQKESATLLDGLSIESIKKSGASDIAAAVKSVPGVSVQDGKFVFVRGLGDRYTKSILNGMDIPGLDPDRNTVQMDIFPTSILENILVIKSATADLPADFSGGVVDIITKDFPAKKQMNISISGAINPDMHFQDNYVTYDGSGTDFLGFDDGQRDLPVPTEASIPLPAASNSDILPAVTRSFDPVMAAKRETSRPNFGIGFNYGNQFTVGENKLGLIGSIDYKNETIFYENFENGVYQKPEQNDEFTLRFDRRQQGDIGVNNVLLSGMVGLSYKTERSKYNLNILRIQNGESRAALFEQDTEISNAVRSKKDNLEYTERSVTNFFISGKHTSESGKFTTEWKASPTFTTSEDKDVRLTTFIFEDDGTFTINSDAGFPNRIWRDLEETNLTGKVDFSMKEELFGRPALFKAGGLYSYKQRDYIISNFDIGLRAFDTRTLNGDPNAILSQDNIWTPQTNSGFFIRGNFQPANKFDAEQNTAAAYLSAEFRPIEKLRAIVGLRAEQFTSRFTGQNNTGTIIFDDEKTIDELDLFPSANFIYELNEKANLRAAYYRTTARPTFKELSVVQINDLLTGLVFLGNIDLQPSYTDNFDLRYEYYGNGSDMFAISGFYKNFDDPIELVAFDIVAPNQFTPRNAPSAEVFGVEFELRKHFGFISQGFEKLSINTNVSFIESQISMNKGPGQEFESRQIFARDGERISSRRSLQGQSPYLVNTGFIYNDTDRGIEAGLFYNVQGQTLEVVGFGKNPDVFVQPFHSLNATFGYKFGENKNHNLSFKVNNLLNDNRDSLYKSFQADPRIFSRRAPRREFSIGYSISL